MSRKPQLLDRKLIAQTRIFRVEQLRLRFSNGKEVDFERIRGSDNGAVLVVPCLDDDTVLLIREYAAGLDRYELAFPKGLMDADETPEQAANREIQEEIGYAARRLTHMRTLSVAPGYATFETHIILAEDLYPRQLPGDEPEPIEVVPWKLTEIAALFEQKDFVEARSVAALYLLQQHLQSRA